MHNALDFIDNGRVRNLPMVCSAALNSNAKPDPITYNWSAFASNILQSNVFVSHGIFTKCQVGTIVPSPALRF